MKKKEQKMDVDTSLAGIADKNPLSTSAVNIAVFQEPRQTFNDLLILLCCHRNLISGCMATIAPLDHW